MKSKIPETITLFSKVWQISSTDLDGKFGDCTHTKLLIRYDPQYPEEHIADTLMHEVIHAIDAEMKIGLKEKQVGKLGTGVSHALKNNPKFRRLFD